jgi:hypothetical protein
MADGRTGGVSRQSRPLSMTTQCARSAYGPSQPPGRSRTIRVVEVSSSATRSERESDEIVTTLSGPEQRSAGRLPRPP